MVLESRTVRQDDGSAALALRLCNVAVLVPEDCGLPRTWPFLMGVRGVGGHGTPAVMSADNKVAI